MWKKAVMAKLKLLSQNLPEGTGGNLSQDKPSLRSDSYSDHSS
jgi:hypothetical protein